MQAIDPIDLREADILKISESKADTATLQQHLTEITEGTVFKGSHRSCEFLRYVVDQAIAGNFDSLKERVIGVELFDRSTSYDTSGDSIVRVTATDVRKRLLHHYEKYGATSAYRISLPPGSYVPEITRVPHKQSSHIDLAASNGNAAESRDSRIQDEDSGSAQALLATGVSRLPQDERVRPWQLKIGRWLLLSILIVTANVAAWGIYVYWNSASHVPAQTPSDLLWTAVLSPSHATHLITSDPSIVVVQEITGKIISVSDYANHNYIPESKDLTPDQIRYSHMILWGDNSSAALDPQVTAGIAALAQKYSRKIDVDAARSLQLMDLKNDDNYVFLGSPRSNPWSALFNDELDFQFEFDNATGREIIKNIHPQPTELSSYVPTARGWATGQSYAIMAFIQNLDQNGQVLILAGASGEGTEAVGKLVADSPRLSAALQKCGIATSGSIRHFELLMRVSMMAGSPNTSDIVACHILPGVSTQKP